MEQAGFSSPVKVNAALATAGRTLSCPREIVEPDCFSIKQDDKEIVIAALENSVRDILDDCEYKFEENIKNEHDVAMLLARKTGFEHLRFLSPNARKDRRVLSCAAKKHAWVVERFEYILSSKLGRPELPDDIVDSIAYAWMQTLAETRIG
jgi:hypothetical protein